VLNDDAFARLVAEDVKNRATDEQKDYLRSPDVRGRWRKEAKRLLNSLDSQVYEIEKEEKVAGERYNAMGEAGKTLLFEARHNFSERKKKIERFRFYVEQRLTEADRLIALGETSEQDMSMTAFLQKSIEKHKALIEQYDVDYNVIDEALWASLGGTWVFDEITEADLE